jgi:hypothetical protein
MNQSQWKASHLFRCIVASVRQYRTREARVAFLISVLSSPEFCQQPAPANNGPMGFLDLQRLGPRTVSEIAANSTAVAS